MSSENTTKKRGLFTKKQAIKFVNILIVLCLLMCALITGVSLCEYHRLDVVMGASELAVLVGIWGGELLLIVVRQVLGSDVRKKKNEEVIDFEEDNAG